MSSVDEPRMRTATDTTALSDSAVSATAIADRRRRARLAGKATGWIFLGDDDHAPAREIMVIDVSRLGVGFTSETQLDVGFVCRIRIGFGPKRLARRLRIVNCRDNSDGTYTLGGEFA
jgi:hypothetical protein